MWRGQRATLLLPRAPSSGMDLQWEGWQQGRLSFMSPRLEVSPGFCLVTGATPGPARPKESPSYHPTLDCEPGLNTLPGRAATLSQAKETDGSGCVKAMALFPLRERKTQVLLPGCSMDLGAQSPIPAQPHQQGPVSWQRQQLLDKDQLQPHWWLG